MVDRDTLRKYGRLIRDYATRAYRDCLREPSGILKYKFIVPGSVYYDELWDWDSWLTDMAISEIADPVELAEYEYGCVLNFLDHIEADGKIPVWITSMQTSSEIYKGTKNAHKPCLAQHALFISNKHGGAKWLSDGIDKLERFIGWYDRNCLHESGLYFWLDDFAIGVDNDPCAFYRPDGSSASIYLNTLMYLELSAMSSLYGMLSRSDRAEEYARRAEKLKCAIMDCCFDERDRSYYSVDINLVEIDPSAALHSGAPRHWSTLIQRIDLWTSFMPLWAGIATTDQAPDMRERALCERTFLSPYGIRSLAKTEKMYTVKKSGNPSCWLGPIWVIANYMVMVGLDRYGYRDDARALAEKTVVMLGRDIEKCGEMHEYYDPETGEGINNRGFQSWNMLALNMLGYLGIDG